MDNNKINAALDTYIKNSLSLRKSSLEFLKQTALDIWEDTYSFKNEKSINSIYIRFCYDGSMWIIDSNYPDQVSMQLEFFWLWNFNSDLLNMISVVAKNSDLCKSVSQIDTADNYSQIKVVFK